MTGSITHPLYGHNPNSLGRVRDYERMFGKFIKSSRTGLDSTLWALWNRIVDLRAPFLFDADADMAKFTFLNGRSVHLCTSTRRFHRPKKTGKPESVTVVVGGFRREYDDPEHQLIPCDGAGKIDCCYFGVAEEEEDLAIFFIEQLLQKEEKRKNLAGSYQKGKIASRRK